MTNVTSTTRRRGGSRNVTLRVTASQLRMINAALAHYEADEHDPDSGYDEGVMRRARERVFNAMDDAGVEP